MMGRNKEENAWKDVEKRMIQSAQTIVFFIIIINKI